jgi:Tfp pilus assembly protein PilN
MSRNAVAFAVAALAILGGVYFDYKSQQDAIKKEMVQWQGRHRKESSLRSQLQLDAAALQESNKVLTRGLKPGQRISDALLSVANDVPEGVWLTGMSLDRGKPMVLRGTAKSSEGVSEFVNKLSSNPRLREAKLVFANQGSLNQTPVVQFSITAVAVANLPLVDPVKPGAKPQGVAK